jgi:exodeoxyribonuclease VII large subunit
LNQLHQRGDLSIDVIIVGRGGGSVEDLWPFNEEVVAQAIFRSRVPVVSAVGHEIDVTVADMVADARAATPTDAAALLTPDRQELLAGLLDAGRRLDAAVWQRLRDARKELDAMASRRALRLPLERVRDQERRLDEIGERLTRAARTRVRSAGDRVAALAGRLETLSPLNVLARGYSLTRTEAGPELVRDADSVRPGDRLRTTVANGEILSRVEEVRPAGRDR